MNLLTKFTMAGLIAASVGVVPNLAFAQDTVVTRKDTIVNVRKDTVVHTKQDTSVVTTTVTTNSGTAPAIQGRSIAALLTQLPNYKTLASLLEETHLLPTLRGAAKFTVFAPTDDAFAKLSPSDLSALRADTTRLRELLLNHVVSGVIDGRELLKLKTATTMKGSRIRFGYENGRPEVNDQPIVQPGIMASNGIIHGISGVIGASGER